jgi:hypothetical protein
VQFLGAIQAEPNQKLVLVEETAPLFIEKNAVGLDGVFYDGAGLLIFPLVFNGRAKEIEPHESRFATLPRNGDTRRWMRLEHLANIAFEHLIGHPKIAAGIEFLFFEKETVLAPEVTDSSPRLGHDVKGRRSVTGRHRFPSQFVVVCS